MDEIKTELVPHEVIENQLLVALDDKSKVGILASEEDLHKLMYGLEHILRREECPKCEELLAGLAKLRDSAFPHATTEPMRNK